MATVCCCLMRYARCITNSCDDFWYMAFSSSKLLLWSGKKGSIEWRVMHMVLLLGYLGHVNENGQVINRTFYWPPVYTMVMVTM